MDMNWGIRLLLGALLFVGSVANASAQGRATINGTVIGPSGAPQPNITLVVTNAQGIDRRAVSDASGAFVFGGLQPGTYRLRTDDETFAPFSQESIALVGGQTLPMRIALQARTPVAAAPTARALVRGTVNGPEGRPLGNATIILTNPQGIDRRAVTELDGIYVFGGLQPGTYRIRIEDPGPTVQPFAMADLTMAPGEQRQLDIRLQPLPVAPLPSSAAAPGRTSATGAQTGVARVQIPTEPDRRRESLAVVPEVTAPGGEFEARPDRWNFAWPEYRRYANESRQPWVVGRPLDPYNQNPAKADFPIGGSKSLFANVNLQLNSAVNPRHVDQGEAVSQVFANNNFVGGLELFRGDTVFQPKSWSVRGTVVGNLNALRANSATKSGRTFGVEEAFAEKRLAVLSPSFDFISVRGGVQNFNSDFRGYLFVDNQLGVRLFGNARANRHQYNLAYFSMRDRDVVSQLHKFTSRNQDVIIANYYVQDFGTPGYTAMFNVHVNRDRGVPADPHALNVTYVGFHGDGKWGGLSVSHAFYQAFGSDTDNRVARGLIGRPAPVDINARMAAIEVAHDADWKRYRASFFYASGDDRSDPTKAKGFDGITDNPNLAGGQFMYWTQQNTKVNGLVPAGAGVLSEKFSLLTNLRSKFTDRSNFVNPGLIVLNGGVDLRVSPKLKVVTNASYLKLADPTVVQQLLAKARRPGFEDGVIGWDVGMGAKFRPFVNENLFVVLGFSALAPRGGFATALGSRSLLHSTVAAIQFAY